MVVVDANQSYFKVVLFVRSSKVLLKSGMSVDLIVARLILLLFSVYSV